MASTCGNRRQTRKTGSGIWRTLNITRTKSNYSAGYRKLETTARHSCSPAQFAPYLLQSVKKANVPKIRFHHLRHTVATLMLSRYINPKVVKKI
ncbi:hypothetical protein EBB07_15440 [Paenibacillaceae bacterium]|nr:hypothetical protein EBB07_15440 [Paenibacillaceae bacterium]